MFLREEEYSSQCNDTKLFGAWRVGLLLSMSERITRLELKQKFCRARIGYEGFARCSIYTLKADLLPECQ